MTVRYVLAPEAALDLAQIWRYVKKQGSADIANHVESVIRERIVFLAGNPSAGHWRKDLTDVAVRFFPVPDCLSPEHKPATSGCNSARPAGR